MLPRPKLNKKVIIVFIIIILWIVLITLIITLRLKKDKIVINTDVVATVEDDTTVDEPEVKVSNFTTKDLSKESILPVLDGHENSDIIADMLLYFPITCDNWILNYNDGYCEVYTLRINETEIPRVTVMKFEEGVYVAHNIAEHKYLVYNSGDIHELSKQVVEASKEVLSKRNNDWLWNEFEASALFVLFEGDLENPMLAVGNGYLVSEERSYYLYSKVESDSISDNSEDVLDENWKPADTFTFDNLVQEIVDSNFDVPKNMDEVFKQYILIPKDYWKIEVVNSELIVYSIIMKDGWHIEHPLFSYNYINESFTVEE